MMRSHLPDPVIIHTEKRSLGLRESQLIQGQGHQEQLLNTESDLTHHLTFQASEEEDASHCAVPISTAVIKQIVNRNQAGLEDSQEHVLADFYGLKNNSQPPWPYVSKDTDRYTTPYVCVCVCTAVSCTLRTWGRVSGDRRGGEWA
uniref:Uncharacterized protein n=1 Tax=Hucho hucho TaxID=62062 RepID=A0A4W5LGI3_9TELE